MKHYTRTKIVGLTIVNIILAGFVAFMCYKSEPEFINDLDNKRAEVGDYVIINGMAKYNNTTLDGLVVQTSPTVFTVRYTSSPMNTDINSGLYLINYNHEAGYRIVGKGTFYHKVNAYVGFNIMLITTLIIVTFFVVLGRVEVLIVWSILGL